jgi:hypothetical protein
MITILTAVFTEDEEEAMRVASWGCSTRFANWKVGNALVRLLTEGIVLPETDEELAEFVAQQSEIEEATNPQARALLALRVAEIAEGVFPEPPIDPLNAYTGDEEDEYDPEEERWAD